MKRYWLVNTALASSLFGLAACNGIQDQSESSSAVAKTEEERVVEVGNVPTPMNLNGQIAFAKKDLAARMAKEPGAVQVSGANVVTWRSGALGCPEPGKAYTEALVPGTVIYLRLDDMLYSYHAKFGEEPFYCPRERAESPVLEEGVDHT